MPYPSFCGFSAWGSVTPGIESGGRKPTLVFDCDFDEARSSFGLRPMRLSGLFRPAALWKSYGRVSIRRSGDACWESHLSNSSAGTRRIYLTGPQVTYFGEPVRTHTSLERPSVPPPAAVSVIDRCPGLRYSEALSPPGTWPRLVRALRRPVTRCNARRTNLISPPRAGQEEFCSRTVP
jgi:hypothetical protein